MPSTGWAPGCRGEHLLSQELVGSLIPGGKKPLPCLCFCTCGRWVYLEAGSGMVPRRMQPAQLPGQRALLGQHCSCSTGPWQVGPQPLPPSSLPVSKHAYSPWGRTHLPAAPGCRLGTSTLGRLAHLPGLSSRLPCAQSWDVSTKRRLRL